MRKLILFLLVFVSAKLNAQVYQEMPQYGYRANRMAFDSTLQIPTVCGVPTLKSIVKTNKSGAIAYDSCNARFYAYNPKTLTWTAITSGSTDTTSLSNRINLKIDSLKRSNDSVYAYRNGTRVFQFKDSIGGGGTTPTLQQVTTTGATSTNAITVPSLNLGSVGNTINFSPSGIDKFSIINSTNGDNILEVNNSPSGSLKFGGGNYTYVEILNNPNGNVALNVPSTNGTIPISVNGNFANSAGNITISTGGNDTTKVPFTGATKEVNLGRFNLTVDSLTIGRGNNHSLIQNTALGFDVLKNTTTGNYNTGVGHQSLHNTTTGQYNTAIGQSSLFTNTTGGQNTAIGLNALLYNLSGGSNVALGVDAFQHNTTGGSNTAIGYNAGSHITNGSTPNTTASNSVFIGRDSKAKVDGESNQIVIGYNAIGNGSNTVTMGNTSTTANYFTGSINGGSFVKSGGTSSQFLKADGSVDASTYLSATDSVSLSNRINLKLNATDTASLSNRINQTPTLTGYQLLGSNIKAFPLGITGFAQTTAVLAHVNQRMSFVAIYIPQTTTVTGVKYIVTSAGTSFVGSANYNGFALYSYNVGTGLATRVDSTANDNTIWTTTGLQSKAFVTPVSLSAGIYYLGYLCQGTATTFPSIAQNPQLNGVTTYDFTSPGRITGYVTGTNTPASFNLSTATSNTNLPIIMLY